MPTTIGRTGMPAGVDILRQLGEWLDAGSCRQVLDWYRAAPATWLVENPEASVLVATAAARTGDYDTATEVAEQARHVLESIGDLLNLFRALNVLGGVGLERGRLPDAWQYYERAHAIAYQLGDPTLLARVTMNMASVRHLRGDGWAAERLYARALAWFDSIADRRGQAQVHQNLSTVAREAGRFETALSAASRAVDLAEQVGDPGLIGMALASRIEAELALGQLDQQANLDRAKALAAQAGDAFGQVDVERLEAAWHLALGRTDQAVEAAEAARRGAKRLGTMVSRGECAAIGAQALRAANQPLLAEARDDEAQLLAELLGTTTGGSARSG